ncbi:MAG: hypothetical protein ACR2P1_15030 [Pseudomonadales bacterium]
MKHILLALDTYLAEGKALELRSMRDWVGRAKNLQSLYGGAIDPP